ncbi:hypothetical protein [Gracilibacillus dipsosauri]|uniref:Lipoprotein n=1 Tax=Gracilibacillus dipsosauri TaxID=178340 RepID=A0A317KZN5_9BACI|nr:hypothetical protein [Gracilibacillus dipsosauri]PWU68250.1 hypothetical protein DLJ74_07275 [Gracilibacillus dipsosauri]
MKFVLKLLWFMSTLCMVISCSTEETHKEKEENVIVQANLTAKENGILTTTTDQFLITDFNLIGEDNKVSIRFEKYKSGKLIKKWDSISTEKIGDGTIVLTFSTNSEDGNQLEIRSGIISKGSTSSNIMYDHLKYSESEYLLGLSDSPLLMEQKVKEEMLIGSFLFQIEGDSIESPRPEFYQSLKENLDEYDVVYLIWAEF